MRLLFGSFFLLGGSFFGYRKLLLILDGDASGAVWLHFLINVGMIILGGWHLNEVRKASEDPHYNKKKELEERELEIAKREQAALDEKLIADKETELYRREARLRSEESQ